MSGGMNGLELAEQIRSEHPKIPILLTAGCYQLPQSGHWGAGLIDSKGDVYPPAKTKGLEIIGSDAVICGTRPG
jgi:hypothetical protein